MVKLNEDGFLEYEDDYTKLYFYRKALVLYDMTFFFKDHYLQRGDRTQDQMEQAARSGKQNIVEGMVDGMTGKEMFLRLLNTSRGSLRELREDYEDYLRVHGLQIWDKQHPRYTRMVQYCYHHTSWRINDAILSDCRRRSFATWPSPCVISQTAG